MSYKDATTITSRNHAEDKGTKHDQGKPEISLVPGDAIEEIAKVFSYGAKKYNRNNWLQGMHWSRLLDASFRHLFAYSRGEAVDPESGLSHLSHAACNLLMLLAYSRRNLGVDDISNSK